jgi:hypothetical protein
MTAACHVRTDLSETRLIGGGAPVSWTPSAPAEDPTTAAMVLRARAAEAAAWLASQKRRVGLICVDSEEAQFLWLKTPSADPMVLGAAVRSAGQDWGDKMLVGSIQPLADPDAAPEPTIAKKRGLLAAWTKPIGKSAAMQAPVRGPVIAAPLGLVRLWLDELDARGVRPDRVATLWHCLASAWAREHAADITAVVAFEPGVRAAWSWSTGANLLAGGQQVMERPAAAPAEGEPAAPDDPVAAAKRLTARLALDWLSWAAHAGTLPKRAVLVGPETARFAEAFRERWPGIEISEQTCAEAIPATVERAGAALASDRSAAADPRRTLTVLTCRPTRAVRTQHRWAAAALVTVAVAIGLLGWRFSAASRAMAATAVEIQEASRGLVKSLNDPTIESSRNIQMSLSSMLTELRKKEPPKLPPEPKPVHDEVKRIADILSRYEGVKLLTLSIDARGTSSLQATVPDRRTSEEIKLELQRAAGALTWTEAGGIGADQQLRLNGNWSK